MFHANAWGLAHAAVASGANLVMPGPDLQPAGHRRPHRSERVTVAAGVPTIWMGVLPELKGRDTSALRAILCGGSAVPRSLSEGYREQIGLPILQAWGMTETSPVASIVPHQVRRSRTAPTTSWPTCAPRVGLVVVGVEFRIVEPGDREPAALGRRDVAASCRSAGRGSPASYYNDDRSAESFTDDGWLRTGDVADDRRPRATSAWSTAPRT